MAIHPLRSAPPDAVAEVLALEVGTENIQMEGTVVFAAGYQAILQDDTGEVLGVITEITEYPAHDVYTIRGAREFMIPAVPDVFIKSVDLEANQMVVHILEGMDSNEI